MATCQKCGGEIQGWTCQGCGQVFRENDAGALVFDAMEAVAWRERVDTDRGQVGAVMDALWPIMGGNHQSSEFWHEVSDAVTEALIATHPVQGGEG